MHLVEPLAPAGYRRIPWKNGRGELIAIDGKGQESWRDLGIAYRFGRTAILEEARSPTTRGTSDCRGMQGTSWRWPRVASPH
jgi:hypothetical protein